MAKQEKYKKEFEKLDFKFETKFLQIPQSQQSTRDTDSREVDREYEQMGKDISEIMSIYQRAKNGFKQEGQIVDFYE